ncbi:hypothetical protein ACIP5Y_15935 [Nocardia sp. NPDC088792]|uniref:hypothetical protein n=1 Tax=Nocardia sp. NPDC088792 TaxID=3364332 RepID=UPI00381BEC90
MIYFSMGYWVLGLALIASFSGASCGLQCIRQSTKSVTARFRLIWLFVAACSIGGVGVSMPIFVSMLGLEVTGSQLRYDTTLTPLCAALSAVTVLVALIVAGKKLNWVRLGIGTVIMAAGIGTIHLLLLSTIRVQGSVDRGLVSIVAVYLIAAVLSGLLLWFSYWARTVPLVLAGSLVYAVLVLGMHYAGLTGLQVHVDPAAKRPAGDVLFDFFVPFFIVSTLSLTVPITAILVAPDRREARVAPGQPSAAHSPSLAVASGRAARGSVSGR